MTTQDVASDRTSALELHAQGWGYSRIAKEFDVSPTTVRRWVLPSYADYDRERSRQNKLRYRGRCRVCGASTNGSNGPGTASDLCWHCAPSVLQQLWTRESIIDAFHKFAQEHGRPPVCSEWTPAMAKTFERRSADLAARDGHKWPQVVAVQRHFGSWNAGVAAAGLEPRPIGAKPRGYIKPPNRPVNIDLHRARLSVYESMGLSCRKLAPLLGIHDRTLPRSIRIARRERIS